MIASYSNTSLSTARRCLEEFNLRYVQQLERVGADREILQVGSTWARAFDMAHKAQDDAAAYSSIAHHSPSDLWAEKLRRMFAAHRWYWASQPLKMIESESTFHVELNGVKFSGQRDGIVELADGRRGVFEQKTTSYDIADEADYWDKLRMDVQVGLYALAEKELPDFILYDVMRKPTIRPKALTKADATRLRKELDKKGTATYFEELDALEIESALTAGRETLTMYGARLTADIGNHPERYFGRREVSRTRADYDLLLTDLVRQVELLDHAQAAGLLHRNPDSCKVFGRCDFFGICSNNIPTDRGIPDGFKRREHLHPELVKPETEKA